MTLIPGLVAAVLLVWALGGELARVGSLRFRRGTILYAALGAQLVAFGPVRILGERQVERVQLVTYALLLAFCIANRRIPGLWLIALGVLANALVITANGGVMPVDPGAIAASGWGLHDYAAAYPNVAIRAHASLWFLGDIFAMPRFPGSAVLSIGDVSIVAGVWLMLQRATSRSDEPGRRPVPRRGAMGWVAGGGAALSAGLCLTDGRAALLVAAIEWEGFSDSSRWPSRTAYPTGSVSRGMRAARNGGSAARRVDGHVADRHPRHRTGGTHDDDRRYRGLEALAASRR